jgi:hypothetical protein
MKGPESMFKGGISHLGPNRQVGEWMIDRHDSNAGEMGSHEQGRMGSCIESNAVRDCVKSPDGGTGGTDCPEWRNLSPHFGGFFGLLFPSIAVPISLLTVR